MMPDKLGVPVDMKVDKRYAEFARQFAIGDVYDGLVELITNSDDSYHRLFRDKRRSTDGGDLLIETEERRKGAPSRIIIRDRAAGLDANEMKEKLSSPGRFSSDRGDRGYMGRGAKDCTTLGDLVYESIKDDRYARCRLGRNMTFTPEIKNQRVTKELREALGIQRGNGTTVTLS